MAGDERPVSLCPFLYSSIRSLPLFPPPSPPHSPRPSLSSTRARFDKSDYLSLCMCAHRSSKHDVDALRIRHGEWAVFHHFEMNGADDVCKCLRHSIALCTSSLNLTVILHRDFHWTRYKKWRHASAAARMITMGRPGLSVCLSVCLPVCLPVCLSVCLSVCVSVSLSLYNYDQCYVPPRLHEITSAGDPIGGHLLH